MQAPSPSAMRNKLACFLLAIAALPTLTPAESAAADPPSPIRWTRGPGAERCIDNDALNAAVTRRLNSTYPNSAPNPRAVVGHIEPSTGKATFRATLTLQSPTGAALGTREVWTSSRDCRALDADLSLVLTLMLDPEATFDAEPAPAPKAAQTPPLDSASLSPSPAPATPESTTPPPDTASSDPPDFKPLTTKPPPPPWGFTARGGPVFSLGFFPSVGAGLALRAALSPPGFPTLEFGGVYWSEQRVSVGTGVAGTNLWLAYGTLAACPVTDQWSGFWGSACAGLEIGLAHTDGAGFFSTSSPELAPLASAAFGAHVRRTIIGRLHGGVGLDVSIPFVRTELYYRSSGVTKEAFMPAPIVATLELALGLSLQ